MIDYEIDGKAVEKAEEKKRNFRAFSPLFSLSVHFPPFLFLSGPRFPHAV